MNIKKVTDALSVTPQIAPEDLDAIAQAGFRAIICNRPDGESADQPAFAEIAQAAKAAGLEARYIPVASVQVSDSDVAAFGAALVELPQPVLAYCRSGTRSATLWSIHAAQDRSLTDILAATTAAGYDMSGLADRIAKGATP